jgi:hypothetical protein
VHAETVSLETIDGVSIEADVVRTDSPSPRAIVIIAHPHPLHGGDRHNHVVAALQRAAQSLGCHSISPDFRGVGNSGGEHDDGNAERLDLAAACELADLLETDIPVVMTGYSFGAVVALDVAHPLVAGWLAVAPPLAMLSRGPVSMRNMRPKIVVAPEHDQFSDPDELRTELTTWENTQLHVIPSVDHFMLAGADTACESALSDLLVLIGA